MCIIPLNVSLSCRRADPFIKLLNRVTVSQRLGSGAGRRPAGVAAAAVGAAAAARLLLASTLTLCDVLLVSNKGRTPLQQLHSSAATIR